MKEVSGTLCKAEKCKKKSTKKNGFCGWCDNKYKKGILLRDGRVKADYCKGKGCKRPSKEEGWCGWCIKKFKRGLFNVDGSLTHKAIMLANKKEENNKKRSILEKKKEYLKLKSDIEKILDLDKLKELESTTEEYRETFGCPYHQIQINPTACFSRMFLKAKTKKRTGFGICQRCTYHDDKLISFKDKLIKLNG